MCSMAGSDFSVPHHIFSSISRPAGQFHCFQSRIPGIGLGFCSSLSYFLSNSLGQSEPQVMLHCHRGLHDPLYFPGIELELPSSFCGLFPICQPLLKSIFCPLLLVCSDWSAFYSYTAIGTSYGIVCLLCKLTLSEQVTNSLRYSTVINIWSVILWSMITM